MNYHQCGFLSYKVIDLGPEQERECQRDVQSLHLPNFAKVDPLFQKAIVLSSEFLFVLRDAFSKGSKANCTELSKHIIVTGLVINKTNMGFIQPTIAAKVGSLVSQAVFNYMVSFVHSKTYDLYKEERQIKQGSFEFQIPPPEDKNKLQLSSLSPTGHHSSASCTKSSYPHSHVSLVHVSSPTQAPPRIRLHFALGGRRTWEDHRAFTKGVVLIFTGQGCKHAQGRQSPCRGPPIVPLLRQ